MDASDRDRRLELLWTSVDVLGEDEFLAEMRTLVAELGTDDPIGLFEQASAFDSTGHPDLAVDRYRRALERGLGGQHRRRAVIQLASSLRTLGQPEEAVALLTAELDEDPDDLDDAVRAFLALALSSVGRDRDAVAMALAALAPHLTRYSRSLSAYARALPPAVDRP